MNSLHFAAAARRLTAAALMLAALAVFSPGVFAVPGKGHGPPAEFPGNGNGPPDWAPGYGPGSSGNGVGGQGTAGPSAVNTVPEPSALLLSLTALALLVAAGKRKAKRS